MPRPVAAVAGLATVLTYNTWLAAQPLFEHTGVFAGYLSELSAADQPHHLFFRIGDMLTGLLVAILALSVHSASRHRPGGTAGRRWRRLVAVGLLVFAVATILDAVFVLDCAPSHDVACHAAERQGQLSASHYIHEVTSVSAQLGATGSLVAGIMAVRPRRWWLLGLGAVHVLALAVMMIMLGAGRSGIGYLQAVTVFTASLWFAAVGLGVLDR